MHRSLESGKRKGRDHFNRPPHSTGKSQPLEFGVFGPFKTAYNKAVDNWMMRNPEKTCSINEVASWVKEADMKAMTPGKHLHRF